MSRMLFELKVLKVFIMDVILHPLTSTRLVVNTSQRSVTIEKIK
jgi:hypothetical protein